MDTAVLFGIVFVTIAVALVAMWPIVCWQISERGGWSKLARHYADDAHRVGEPHRRQSATIGGMSYNHCVTLLVCESGLQLSMFGPFRVAHPTLFVPWTDFHDAHLINKGLFQKWLVVEVGSPSVCTLKLPVWLEEYLVVEST